MSGGTPVFAFLLVVALVAANLPFFTSRIFFVLAPASGAKAFGWRLAEVVAMYFVVGGMALWLEAAQGQIYSQRWEFYAITFCMFLVLAYPGFVYCYLWKRSRDRREDAP